eukprot:TRINITY_DN23126_c0_g1_i1.p1 TRINITY_DN23126_c0_g1~~TRINITY_DN23126_c0_g1_i1.p1  ORF type:complete len:259 (-),score=64.96 TRINITY_DN23126_c0_g1_i1:495-1271(-)
MYPSNRLPRSQTGVWLLMYVAVSGAFTFEAQPYDSIQGAFLARKQGWLGADSAATIALSPQLSLMLFGDTLIGHQTPAGGRQFVWGPRNTLGLLHLPDAPVENLTATDLSFYWGLDANNLPRSFFPEQNKYWYWVNTGVVADNELFLFAMKMESTGQPGPFGFAVVCATVMHVANPLDDPNNWDVTTIDVPGSNANLYAAAAAYQEDGWIYVFGIQAPSSQVLARISVKDAAADNWGALVFWGTDRLHNRHGVWFRCV